MPFKKTVCATYAICVYFYIFGTCYAYYMIVTWLPNFFKYRTWFPRSGNWIVLFAGRICLYSRSVIFLVGWRISTCIKSSIHRCFRIFLATAMLLLTVQVSNATLLLIALIMYGFLGKLAVEPIIISWLGENAPKKLELALLWACLTFSA